MLRSVTSAGPSLASSGGPLGGGFLGGFPGAACFGKKKQTTSENPEI